MPARDRQSTLGLLLSLGIAAVVAFSLVAGAPSALGAVLLESAPSSPSKPSSPSRPSGSASGSASAKPARSADCGAARTPPPAERLEDNDGRRDPGPLEVPEQAAGGGRMGECGAVIPPNAPLPPDGLTAAAWIIADQDSGDVLAANAPHARHWPAATVKLLLAMVALRELDPNATITATRDDMSQKGTRIGLVPDARYTVRDLIRALIVSPANDVANALARQVGGVDAALNKMNDLARKLGALDTRATNVTGLDSAGMATSAYDAALIFREAMRHPEFADATGATATVINTLGGRAKKITRTNDNQLLESYAGATGGKAGNTDAAKSTFVGTAQRDGRRLVVALLRAEKTSSAPFDQAISLLDYGFTLAKTRTEPVGHLGGEIDGAKNRQPPQLQATVNQETKALADRQQRSAFGTVGLPLTIAAALVVLVGVVLTVRRKMARARRARAS